MGRLAARVALGAMVMTLALAGWLIPPSAARAARLDSNPTVTIDIQNPQPRGNVAQGPVGANVYAQGATQPGDQVTIGFALQSVGCQTGFQQIAGAQPDIQPNGQFTVAFKWPDAANSVNTEYYLCAQDTTASAIGQSPELYLVNSADAPAINVQQVDNPTAPTAIPGTPTPAPTATARAGKIYSGGYLQIQGANFLPGGQNVSFFLTPGPFTPGDYAPGNALNVISGNIRTANDGSFQVVVQLPAGETGSLTISAVSQDGNGALLPTLVASQRLSIITPPATPTPQPTASPTVQVTVTPGNGSGHKSAPGPFKITGLIGLGTLSVILFIIGVSFLISASSMPKS
ncbi:MAG TPA: hypothetical protein VFQ25_05920 [Ktedonobacterales bacterium]|nr:hypothetical protein [Ktedonobacterales bacterium]